MFIATKNISISRFKEMITEEVESYKKIKNNKQVEFYNIPAAFDIETSSFYDQGEKRAIMYEWTFGICGHITIGRTWDEFIDLYNFIVKTFKTTHDRRLIVYVHNLAFEFQFIRCRFEWAQLFAIKDRTPIYARTVDGVEFRCSYLLSGYSLKTVGEHLQKHEIEKLSGDLDYTLLRHSETEMTPQEMQYCINDVAVILAYIDEEIEKNKNITRIPLTKTGYVRRYCRNACLYGDDRKNRRINFLNYRSYMRHNTMCLEEYFLLKRAFQGGFTHANAFHVGKTLHDVDSYDFTSSYPAVMVAEEYPMSSGEKVTVKTREQFERNISCYCCVFDVEFVNIRSTVLYEHYISRSRCTRIESYNEDNGRVVDAKLLRTTITEQDYFIIQKMYQWDEIHIGTFYRFKRGYLPTQFIKSILSLYADKTRLKGVTGAENDYLLSKELLNSCYGMAVTDICRDEIVYRGGEWSHETANYEEQIEKYNNSKSRFLVYAWGIYVTAYARRNLFTAINTIQNDYVYSDTDSVKILNGERYRDYFNRYNEWIEKRIAKALEFHALNVDLARPKTVKGKIKPLGVWDFESRFNAFKTLGAKRYMVQEKDALIINYGKEDEQHFDYSITVSGVNKINAVPYILEKAEHDRVSPFDVFNDEMYIPPDYTGKMTHTYIDEECSGTVIDYQGNEAGYNEKSFIHLEKADYTLSLAEMFIDYLYNIGEYEK